MKNKVIITISSVVVIVSVITLVYLYCTGDIFKSNKTVIDSEGYTEVTVPVIPYDDITSWHDAWIGMERIEEYIPMDDLPDMITSIVVGEPSRGIPLACIYIGLGFTKEDSVEFIDRTPENPNVETSAKGWLIDGEWYEPTYWIVNGEKLLILQNSDDESKVLYKPYDWEY